MKVRKINKTKSVEAHLRRYGSIDQMTAIQLYRCFDLASAIRRIRNKRALEIENIKGKGYVGKYQIVQ